MLQTAFARGSPLVNELGWQALRRREAASLNCKLGSQTIWKSLVDSTALADFDSETVRFSDLPATTVEGLPPNAYEAQGGVATKATKARQAIRRPPRGWRPFTARSKNMIPAAFKVFLDLADVLPRNQLPSLWYAEVVRSGDIVRHAPDQRAFLALAMSSYGFLRVPCELQVVGGLTIFKPRGGRQSYPEWQTLTDFEPWECFSLCTRPPGDELLRGRAPKLKIECVGPFRVIERAARVGFSRCSPLITLKLVREIVMRKEPATEMPALFIEELNLLSTTVLPKLTRHELGDALACRVEAAPHMPLISPTGEAADALYDSAGKQEARNDAAPR
jgi:hypothetical protein